jgi:glycosyltransferase involved in cell wall biosynthesis
MWLAWLLRADAREGAAVNEPEAQREFVIWWLLRGADIFPGGWWYGPDQVALAMERVEVGRGLRLPRLLRAVHRRNPEIGASFPLDNLEDGIALCCWYRLSGAGALRVAPPLPHAEMLATEAPCTRAPWSDAGTEVPRMAVAMYDAMPALRTRYAAGAREGREALAAWYVAFGRRLVPQPQPVPSWPEPVPLARGSTGGRRGISARRATRPPGASIIGYANQGTGIGEDVRMLAASLAAAGVAHQLIDVEPGAAAEAAPERQVRFAATIFCLNAFDTARLFLEHGPSLFAGPLTIGCWPWELPDFPPVWREVCDLVDEIWAASRFTLEAMVAAGAPRVRLMPPAVTLPAIPRLVRRDLGLPERRFLFVYPLDARSYLARKNPLGAVAAFREAFLARDRTVGLVLRVNGEPDEAPGWPDVATAVARDGRIVVVPGHFERDRALALIACCDCLISPHRAEGFGRNIAEALLLGIPVLATAFSGCTDFLAPGESIAWSRRAVEAAEYPFGEGSWWAEPDIVDLAARMRRIRDEPAERRALRARRRAKEAAKLFAPEHAGLRYAAALGAHGTSRGPER